MITLVVVFQGGGDKIFPNMTMREFGERLVELSKEYCLCYDTISGHQEQVGCIMYVTAYKRDEMGR